MRRLAAALAIVALSACAGTETGNPSFEGELAYNTHTSNAAVAALSAEDAMGDGARVGSAWLVLGDARFVRADLCDAREAIEAHATGIGAGDHATEAAARSSFELEVGDYCGLELPLLRAAAAELPDGAPAALQDHSIVIGGTLGDGTPFRIESAREGPVFIGSATTSFHMDADGARVLIGFDLAAWLEGLDLTGAARDAGGTVVVSTSSNAELLQAFEANLEARHRPIQGSERQRPGVFGQRADRPRAVALRGLRGGGIRILQNAEITPATLAPRTSIPMSYPAAVTRPLRVERAARIRGQSFSNKDNRGKTMNSFKITLIMLAIGSLAFVGCDDDDNDAGSMSVTDMGSAGSGSPGNDTPGNDTPGNDTPGNDTPDDMVADGPGDIIDVALAAGSFTQLAEALTAADLVDALKGDGPFTVFAPTDDAFAAFEAANPGVLESLSVEELTGILTYHVVAGAAVMSGDLQNGQLAETLAGPVLAVDLSNGVKINGIDVTTADIEASNGVIHVIDQIIIPPGDIIEVATAAGSFSELAGALTAANLVETLQGEGPFTVFAPTDAAFQALSAVPEGDALIDVLLYHVMAGIAGPLDLADGGVAATVNGAPVLFDLSEGAKVVGGSDSSAVITTTNVVASNGVIHVIDAVILPPTADIVETAVAAGSFSTLASALTSQDLVATLQGEGPFTVFAPTDDAFAQLSALPEGDALTNVLLYHVVDGYIGSGNLSNGEVEMLSGAMIDVDLSEGVMINDSSVSTANILTRNGVIHVIDSVLLPPAM